MLDDAGDGALNRGDDLQGGSGIDDEFDGDESGATAKEASRVGEGVGEAGGEDDGELIVAGGDGIGDELCGERDAVGVVVDYVEPVGGIQDGSDLHCQFTGPIHGNRDGDGVVFRRAVDIAEGEAEDDDEGEGHNEQSEETSQILEEDAEFLDRDGVDGVQHVSPLESGR